MVPWRNGEASRNPMISTSTQTIGSVAHWWSDRSAASSFRAFSDGIGMRYSVDPTRLIHFRAFSIDHQRINVEARGFVPSPIKVPGECPIHDSHRRAEEAFIAEGSKHSLLQKRSRIEIANRTVVEVDEDVISGGGDDLEDHWKVAGIRDH